MSRFAHLNKESPERKALWDKHKDKIEQLLIEVNNDVFKSQATLGEFDYHGYYAKAPEVNKPYLCLNTKKGSLCVFINSALILSVIAENNNNSVRWYPTSETFIEKTLEDAIEFLLW